MQNKKIKTDKEYRIALQEIEKLMNTGTGTPAGEQLNKLITLVEDYEDDLELVKITKKRLNNSSIVVDIEDI